MSIVKPGGTDRKWKCVKLSIEAGGEKGDGVKRTAETGRARPQAEKNLLESKKMLILMTIKKSVVLKTSISYSNNVAAL